MHIPVHSPSYKKNDDCKTIAFVTYEIQVDNLRHLPFFRLPDPSFISGSGVCRSSDFYIQLQPLLKLHQRTYFAFSPGHYSPSNDRLSPYADYPAQKPEYLLEKIVLASTEEGQVILDPFCGSGTTGVEAVRFGRKFIGIDVSEEYLEISKRRLEKVYGDAKEY